MPRQNLYVKDGRSRTTSIRVNPLLYDAVRQQGGNVEDLFETALSAYLHVPPEVLVRLHREEELLEHCYEAIRAGQEEALARELAHGWRVRDRSGPRRMLHGGRCLLRCMRRCVRFRSRDGDVLSRILPTAGSVCMRRSW